MPGGAFDIPGGERDRDRSGLKRRGLASAFLEPDPEVQWDDDRLASVRRALRTWAPPDARYGQNGGSSV